MKSNIKHSLIDRVSRLVTLFLFCLTVFGALPKAFGADVNILIIGSTKDTSDYAWISGSSAAFNPTEIKSHLKSILEGAGVGSVNVTLEERYQSQDLFYKVFKQDYNWYTSAKCYNLASWFHYPYPADVETDTRWPNLRGEKDTDWDYVVLIGDPYTMEYMPGIYAHGVAKIAEEVAKGDAETLLLMPWPTVGSQSSVAHYKEVVYRAGRSGGYKVVPAGLAWQGAGSPSGVSHPNDDGAYICAAAIYSRVWGKSAKESSYTYSDALADNVHNTVTTNIGKQQYSGTFSFNSPTLMHGDLRRKIYYSNKGSSTENAFKEGTAMLLNKSRLQYDYSTFTGKYSNNTPTGAEWTGPEVPIAWNHGRSSTSSNKNYVINPDFWKLAFGYDYQSNTWDNPTDLQNDIHISQMFDNDISLASEMMDQGDTARILPVRTLWAEIHKELPDLKPQSDGSGPHLSGMAVDAVSSYMYTLYSGRCAVGPKPNPVTTKWLAYKIGYETAWRMGRCVSRAPGFQVMPSSSVTTTVTPGAPETMTVQFHLPPKSDVTVNVSLSDSKAKVIGPSTFIFTPSNYATPQQVVIAKNDGSAASGSFDVRFNTVSSDSVFDGLRDSWEYSIDADKPLRNPENPSNTVSGLEWIRVDKDFNKSLPSDFSLYEIAASGTGDKVQIGFEGEPKTGFAYVLTGYLNVPVDGRYTFFLTSADGSKLFLGDGLVVDNNGRHGVVTKDGEVWLKAGKHAITVQMFHNWRDPSKELKLSWKIPGSVEEEVPSSAYFRLDDGQGNNNPPLVNAGSDQTITSNSSLGNISMSWSPTEITTAIWLDANDASTITQNSGRVSLWEDKSGNNRHAAQAIPANQPTLTSNGLNGKSVINFDGSSGYLDVDLDMLAGVSHSSFIVTKTTTYTDIYGAANHNAGANSLHVGFSSATSYRTNYWGNDFNAVVSNNFKPSEANLLNYRWTTGTGKDVLANGSLEGSNSSAGSIGTMSGGGRLGKVVNHGYYGGDIAEFIIITGNLSLADRQKMEGYLAHKWGLEGYLPAVHPYKTAPFGSPDTMVNLDGTVSDPDGDSLTTTWSAVNGPGSVLFGDVSAVDTTATFSSVGTYVLRLTVNDGTDIVFDEVTITVNAPASAYENWTGGSFDKEFTDTDPMSDPDGDGLSNEQEFAFGTDPTLNKGGSLAVDGSVHGLPVPVSTNGGTSFDFYFLRRKDHAVSGSITYTPQFSSDLSSFTTSLVPPTVVVESLVDSAYEVVRVPYPVGTQFGRVKTDVTP